MARHKSDDKRKAILDAAVRVFAERGIANAPTSAISHAAGVAEGSLFTYFETKHDLMNALYLELRAEFSGQMADIPRDSGPQARLRFIWEKYLDLGKASPHKLKVQAQLRASGRLFRENEPRSLAIDEVLAATRQAVDGNELRNAPPEYLVLALRAVAEATIEFINAHPEHESLCRELGFAMLWRGIAGE